MELGVAHLFLRNPQCSFGLVKPRFRGVAAGDGTIQRGLGGAAAGGESSLPCRIAFRIGELRVGISHIGFGARECELRYGRIKGGEPLFFFDEIPDIDVTRNHAAGGLEAELGLITRLDRPDEWPEGFGCDRRNGHRQYRTRRNGRRGVVVASGQTNCDQEEKAEAYRCHGACSSPATPTTCPGRRN